MQTKEELQAPHNQAMLLAWHTVYTCSQDRSVTKLPVATLVFLSVLYYLRTEYNCITYNIKENMKKYILLLAMIVAIGTAQAQLFKKRSSVVEPQYQQGMVPVINGKVTFEEVIPATGLNAAEVEERVNNWITRRFVEPTIISVKRYESEKPGTAILKGEEYMIFRKTFFVLNRPRIYYYLTITAQDGQCIFNMSRITYWYDDEDENGGIKMKAENWITDENAFNSKGKLKKFEGRFRRKTIDLKNQLIEEIKSELNSK